MKCHKPLVSVAVGLQPDLQQYFLLSPSTLCRFDWCEVVSASRAFFLDFFFHANEPHHYLSGAGNLKAARVTVFLPRAGVLVADLLELNTFATKNRYKLKSPYPQSFCLVLLPPNSLEEGEEQNKSFLYKPTALICIM